MMHALALVAAVSWCAVIALLLVVSIATKLGDDRLRENAAVDVVGALALGSSVLSTALLIIVVLVKGA